MIHIWRSMIKNLSQVKLVILTSVFLVLFDNYSFFKNTILVYPLAFKNIGFLLSLAVVLMFFVILLFTLLSSRYTTKPVLISTLLVSSLTNYFMNSYNVVIDESMIRNMLQTNIDESMDLFNIKFFLYFIFFGVLPSLYIYRLDIVYKGLKAETLSKIKTILISIFIILGSIFIFSKFYTSFFREHKPLRYYTNPTYWIYSIGKYINLTVSGGKVVVKHIGDDAKIREEDGNELVIVVVGETARADHFSLNGYEKKTNPLLEKENIINFSNMYSCGTSTAISVPCMFSVFDKSDYSYKKGISTENILDVLKNTNNLEILWRDNNSDSKGVALRIPFQDYKLPENNTICTDGECRDEGMIVGLDKYIEKHKGKDILIILHQMGNHGPAYYKRYPKEFEKFTPVCKTNQLEECSKEEISNAYDNALLYTDFFLSKVINFLKKYDGTHEAAMIYMSDHGESLGESGVYLHGLPYFMAPEAQTHIGSLMWFGKGILKEIDEDKIKLQKDVKYTQDNLFHTLLGIFEVETNLYDYKMDMIHGHQ